MTDAPIRVGRIVDIADYVEACLDVLSAKRPNDLDTYRSDRDLRDIVERRLETMTRACVDIGRILLVDLDRSVPESNPATMYALNDWASSLTRRQWRWQKPVASETCSLTGTVK